MRKLLRQHWRWITCVAVAASFCLAVAVWVNSRGNVKPPEDTPAGVRSLARSELELRDGVLYVHGEAEPFQGQIVEYYREDARKLVLEVKDGRLEGHSRGWHENGQMEVD